MWVGDLVLSPVPPVTCCVSVIPSDRASVSSAKKAIVGAIAVFTGSTIVSIEGGVLWVMKTFSKPQDDLKITRKKDGLGGVGLGSGMRREF